MSKIENLPGTAAAEVQQPLLQGRQDISGLWFPVDWFDEATLAKRILACWSPGAQVFRFTSGWLLRYPQALPMHCDTAPGWPLQRTGDALSSAPISEAERGRLPAADIYIISGGQALALHWGLALRVDAGAWLETTAYSLHDTYDCSAALATTFTPLVAEARPLRDVLGGKIPPPSGDQVEFLRQLALAQSQANRPVPSPNVQLKPTAPRKKTPAGPSFFTRQAYWMRIVLFAVIGASLFLLLIVITTLLNAEPAVNQADAPATQGSWQLLAGPITAIVIALIVLMWKGKRASGAVAPRPVPAIRPANQYRPASPEKSLKARGQGRFLPQRWRQLLARMAITSQVAKLLGQRQSAYMRKMLALFENGDLNEALRHAIPLGGQQGNLGQAFGTPQARNDLSLSRQLGGSVSIGLGNDLNAYLQKLYRQSFERLDREGRIDDAVFVLAELLNARREALDYLEKQQRYQQAAELALAWDMPSDVIVRLHCLTGDWRTALAVARRDHAFSGAVSQLQGRWPDAAKRLRAEWAQALAASGEWLKAIDVAWPLPEMREQAADWLRSAQQSGGCLASRALVLHAALLPDALSTHASLLTQLRDDPDAGSERQAVAEALLELEEHSSSTRRIASLLFGAILADQLRGTSHLNKLSLQNLLKLSGDKLLAADLPTAALPAHTPQPLWNQKPALKFQAPTAGLYAVVDAVALERGRYLIALGEAGAVLVDAQGKRICHFAVPTYRLVLAHSRHVALALARRDSVWRVSRLDLVKRTITDLGVLAFDCHTGEFDGIGWTVSMGRRLCVLDTTSSLRNVLWQVTDLPGQIISLTALPTQEHIVVENGHGGMELWRYQLPQRRLVVRDRLYPPSAGVQFRLYNAYSGYIDGWLGKTPQGDDAIHYQHYQQIKQVLLTPGMLAETASIQSCTGPGMMAINLINAANESRWQLIQLGSAQICAQIGWPAGEGLSMRFAENDCLLFDGSGRLLHIDMQTSLSRGFGLR